MVRVPVAVCTIKQEPAYRRQAFVGGLHRLGYRVSTIVTTSPEPADILVMWNRHGTNDQLAARYLRHGCRVIIVENGYLGFDRADRQLYAMARDHHNGAGRWPDGPEDRWGALAIELKPWRIRGAHLLVLPQRGVGPLGVAMPTVWSRTIEKRLRQVTKRKVIVRPHPGLQRLKLAPALQDVWAAVTWGSGAGIKAIVAGIPVFHELPNWIGAPAAKLGLGDMESPWMGDRLPMLRRLAWAQWTVEEIASGDPLARLLELGPA